MKIMKIIKIIFFIYLSIVSVGVFSQVKVKNTGKFIIGEDRTSDDYYNVLSGSVFGKIGDSRAGSKLAFGDFGNYYSYGWNVFIGEYSNTDSDQLWLHGKNGIFITRGRGDSNEIIAKYEVSNPNEFHFLCDVYANSTLLTSDERFKTNIVTLDSALIKLNRLNGVSYNYNFPDMFFGQNQSISDSPTENSSTGETSEKEMRDADFFEEYNRNCKSPNRKRLGFIAQELKQVFPDLVDQDTAGYCYVDYVGLIPVIIEAIKEQQSIITAQSLKIKELQNALSEDSTIENNNIKSSQTSTSTEMLNSIATNAFLFQNTPNPFTIDTEIKFFIPEGTTNAVLYIFNMQGTLLLSKTISGTGNGSIMVNGSELTPGMYIYSLIINGQEVDTKRMILTE